jgi:hypothetical protein
MASYKSIICTSKTIFLHEFLPLKLSKVMIVHARKTSKNLFGYGLWELEQNLNESSQGGHNRWWRLLLKIQWLQGNYNVFPSILLLNL